MFGVLAVLSALPVLLVVSAVFLAFPVSGVFPAFSVFAGFAACCVLVWVVCAVVVCDWVGRSPSGRAATGYAALHPFGTLRATPHP